MEKNVLFRKKWRISTFGGVHDSEEFMRKQKNMAGHVIMKDDYGGNKMEQIEFKFDTQLLIAGEGLDEDEIYDYIVDHFIGDSLLVAGDDDLIKIHYHTNEPWLVLEYGQSIGDIYDVVVENMQRQAEGLQG